MPTKRTTRVKKQIEISFDHHDDIIGYSWSVVAPNSSYGAGGGYESLLDIFNSSNFMETLVKHFGKGCIPTSAIKAAKREEARSRIPIPEDAIPAIKKALRPFMKEK